MAALKTFKFAVGPNIAAGCATVLLAVSVSQSAAALIAPYQPHDQAAYANLAAAGVNWKETYSAPAEPLVRDASMQSAASTKPEPVAETTATAPVTPTVVETSFDLAAGTKLFKRCSSCHSVKEGARHKTGPNLWGIVEGQQAAAEKYKYSKAFKALTGTWTETELDSFLENPRSYARGTKMNFKGLAKPDDRANLIGYLTTLQ